MTPTRALLLLIDGLRPDGLMQAHAPHLHSLMQRGAYSLTAQTVMPSITLPCHLSLFYSVPPGTHGIQSNTFPGRQTLGAGLVETLHAAGKVTTAFYNWEELRDLWRPGAMHFTSFINLYRAPNHDFDVDVAQAAAERLTTQPDWDFAFVYLGMLDERAHQAGWMSPDYLEAITAADAAAGLLLQQLEDANLLQDTLVLALADHGGHGYGHGNDIPEDITIPWILAGPGIQAGVALQQPVSILDSAPTLAHALGLAIPEGWMGQVVREALA